MNVVRTHSTALENQFEPISPGQINNAVPHLLTSTYVNLQSSLEHLTCRIGSRGHEKRVIMPGLISWVVVSWVVCFWPHISLAQEGHAVSFEEFRTKWEATKSERVLSSFTLKNTEDENFVVDIGDRLAGSDVPIKISLTNEYEFPISAKTKPSCGCTAGVPEKFEVDSKQSRDFLLLYKVPSALGRVSASIYCADPNVRARFAIHIAGRSTADFRISKPLIELESDDESLVYMDVSPVHSGVELGEFELRLPPNANFLSISKSNRKADQTVSLEISVAKSEGRLLDYAFEIVHVPSQIGVPVTLRYINRVQSFPRAAVFREHEGKFTCRLMLRGSLVRNLIERPDLYSVVIAKDGATAKCSVDVTADKDAARCTLTCDAKKFLENRELGSVQFLLNGEVVFSAPCFWLE